MTFYRVYWDRFIQMLVTEKDVTAPPERYVLLISFDENDMYVEKYMLKNGEVFSFAFTDEELDSINLNETTAYTILRKNAFERSNISTKDILYQISNTMPFNEFKDLIEKSGMSLDELERHYD